MHWNKNENKSRPNKWQPLFILFYFFLFWNRYLAGKRPRYYYLQAQKIDNKMGTIYPREYHPIKICHLNFGNFIRLLCVFFYSWLFELEPPKMSGMYSRHRRCKIVWASFYFHEIHRLLFISTSISFATLRM